MRGIILLNLGTPDSPHPKDVKNYLAEFLSDPLVIDIPSPLRWLLLHGIILRTRPKKSAHAYQAVWTDRGSPLLVNHLELTEALTQAMPEAVIIPAMRYGKPSLTEAFTMLQQKKVTSITAIPLYPQYSQAATESSILETQRIGAQFGYQDIHFVPAFFDDKHFIEALRQSATPYLQDLTNQDHVLMSFHGLPERHIAKMPPEKCYKAQSHRTASLLAQALGLSQWSVGFQSRLGRTPWIQPFTDMAIQKLAQQGTKRLFVICPSFVADCLETLEEIGIRARADFIAHGGKELILIPCLNAHPAFVRTIQSFFT